MNCPWVRYKKHLAKLCSLQGVLFSFGNTQFWLFKLFAIGCGHNYLATIL